MLLPPSTKERSLARGDESASSPQGQAQPSSSREQEERKHAPDSSPPPCDRPPARGRQGAGEVQGLPAQSPQTSADRTRGGRRRGNSDMQKCEDLARQAGVTLQPGSTVRAHLCQLDKAVFGVTPNK